ncbi:MAG: Rsd/AlgQ family anti-sigma factor [Gammaproteobacteria bacterium]|nr:Rsd/AlgQ family anti-sigma factor [Gammaproteobacteria bacterium]
MNSVKHQPHFDRRTRTQKEIKQLIAERNNVLSQYYSLTSHADDYDAEDIESLKELLQEFCQDMVDYLATGHFEIYQRIEDGVERRDELLDLSSEAFEQIINTTKAAINFNDFYDLTDNFNPEILKSFPRQLSELGENLATRIELEDKFINSLLSPKPRLVYSAH